jgi:VanZ family protein
MPLRIVCAIGWIAAVVIIVLSVVPGDLRPQVLEDKHFEHFLAYFVAGGLFATGYLQARLVIFLGILLTLCSGIVEIAQLGIAGRTANIFDFIASASGTWIGLVVGRCLRGIYFHVISPKGIPRHLP